MARLFDGIDDYVSIADSAALTLGAEYTTLFWMRPDNLAGTGLQFLYSWGTSSAPKHQVYLFESGHATPGDLVVNRNNIDVDRVTNPGFVAGTWYAIVVRVQAGTFQIFVDGASLYSIATTATTDAATPLHLGARGYDLNVDRFFPGAIADVAKWDTALTDAQITALSSVSSGTRARDIPTGRAYLYELTTTGATEPEYTGGTTATVNGATTTAGPAFPTTTTPPPPALDPGSIAAGTVTETSVAITNSASASGGSGTITYQHHRSTSAMPSPPTSETAISGATAAAYTHTGLATGTTYYFKRVATDGAAATATTAGVSATTTAPTRTTPATFYVSAVGSDTNTGTTTTAAWKTIAKVNADWAAGLFIPGDAIRFRGGDTFAGPLQPRTESQGTDANRITIGSYGTGRATISATATTWPLDTYNCGGLIVEDLNAVANGTADHYVMKFRVDGGAGARRYTGLTVRRCDVSRGKMGISVQTGGTTVGWTNVLVEDVVAHDNVELGMHTRGDNPSVNEDFTVRRVVAYNNTGVPTNNTGSGIQIIGVTGALVEHCRAYNNGTNGGTPAAGPCGIWFYMVRNGTIQHCESYNNRTSSTNDGGGFDIDGGCIDCVIQYCYSHGNDGAGYLAAQFPGALPMYRNVFRYNVSENDCRKSGSGALHIWDANGDMDDTVFLGNTVYLSAALSGAARPEAIRLHTNTKNARFLNNIIVVTGGVPLLQAQTTTHTGLVVNGNNFFAASGARIYEWGSTTYNTLAAWKAAAGTGSGTEIDPLLQSPGQGGTIGDTTKLTTLAAYTLQSGSTMPTAGVDLGSQTPAISRGPRDYYNKTAGATAVGAASTAPAATTPEPTYTCSMQAPASGASFAAGSTVTLAASTANGTTTGLSFYKSGGTLIGAATFNSASGWWERSWAPGSGSYDVYAVATQSGGTATSATRSFTIQSSTTTGTFQYEWRAQPVGSTTKTVVRTWSTTRDGNADLSALPTGDVDLFVRARDAAATADVGTDSAPVRITIQRATANKPPTAPTVTLSTTSPINETTVTASGGSDPEGKVLVYRAEYYAVGAPGTRYPVFTYVQGVKSAKLDTRSLAAGTYNAVSYASDGELETASAAVAFTVFKSTGGNPVPLAIVDGLEILFTDWEVSSPEYIGDRARAFSGVRRNTVRSRKRNWTGTTIPLPLATYDAIVARIGALLHLTCSGEGFRGQTVCEVEQVGSPYEIENDDGTGILIVTRLAFSEV